MVRPKRSSHQSAEEGGEHPSRQQRADEKGRGEVSYPETFGLFRQLEQLVPIIYTSCPDNPYTP